MENLFQRLMLGGSTVALLAITSTPGARAQGDDIEQVVVSASRISIQGYTQPTPVTVVGAAQLANDAYADIQDSVRNLPQFASPPADVSSTAGSGSGGNAGEQLLNLRNLGNTRTLVLFGGQRVVASNITGGVDVSTLPSSLIQRVDVVTGGASAVWGSDAVAGVVNFVLNKNFNGFKANVQASESVQGLNPSQTAEVDWGTDVFGGRGHLILAATASFKPQPIPVADLDWYKKNQGPNYWVQNPAFTPTNGQTVYIRANNVGNAQATQGGLITGSPAVAATGTPANVLRGIQFVGSSASPTQVNFGNITSGALSNGGSLGYLDGEDAEENVGVPTNRYTGFAYGSYKLTDTILASLQLNYGYTSVWSRTDPFTQQLTIKSGNPYIPAAIQSTMTASGITSFTLGEILANNFNNQNVTPTNFKSMTQNSGNITLFDRRQMMRGVFELDGTLGNDWGWSSYLEHSTVQVSNHTFGAVLKQNIPLAADAVLVTKANVGTSGLSLGSIACSSTLTAPTNGCVPLNVFGTGNTTPAQFNYLTQNSADYEAMVLNQDMLEGSLQGTLPWELPAGKVAVAGGANWRQEEAVVRSTLLGPAGDFSGAGYGPFPRRSYHVFEGFAEVNAPILKNNIVQSLDMDVAGRVTDYSTSGVVETWKVGLTSQIDDNFRFRASESVDIRAPGLNELFNANATATQPQVDPKTQQTVQIPVDTQGNPNLLPEVARTFSAGLVLTPSFIPGLNFSVDYYSIKVTGEIATIPTATILNQCNPTFNSTIHPGTKGDPNDPLCSVLQFNGPVAPGFTTPALSFIVQQPTNFAYQTTDGVDLAADYSMDLWNGKLNLSALANLDAENTTFNFAAGFNDSIGSNGIPKWRGRLSANYVTGPYSFTIQNRWYGTSVEAQNADTGNLATATTANYYPLSQFEVPMVFYVDLRGSYQWNENIQIYAAMDNALNQAPPLIPITFGNIQSQGSLVGTNVTTYDMLGQVVRLGLRFSY